MEHPLTSNIKTNAQISFVIFTPYFYGLIIPLNKAYANKNKKVFPRELRYEEGRFINVYTGSFCYNKHNFSGV